MYAADCNDGEWGNFSDEKLQVFEGKLTTEYARINKVSDMFGYTQNI